MNEIYNPNRYPNPPTAMESLSMAVAPMYQAGQRIKLSFADRTGTVEASVLYRMGIETYVVEYKVRWDDAPERLSSLYYADLAPMQEVSQVAA